ncbi:hypothetical protein [Lachnospira multipara]|uniref:hypothetical protein n=1 Tax=Lachnospira multipara TaxID=28051 RepID=UPI0011B01A1D|nr:hypothetical protein [Lachnospira multipara]
MILAFLMVFNLVVFTGQVGAFADGTTSNDVGESNQNTSSDTTSNGSVTVKILTNFVELTSVSQISKSSKTEIAMIPEKYGTNDVIMGLPDGSALVKPIALASDTDTLDSITEFSNLVYPSYSASKANLQNAAGTRCINPNQKDSVYVVQPSKAGKGFDLCPYGSIVYLSKGTEVIRDGNDSSIDGKYELTEDSWFYNCCGGGVSNVGPFFIYTYDEDVITYSANNVEIEFKEGSIPLIKAGTVDPSSLEAVIKVGGTTYTVPSIELTDDNTVNPDNDDYTVTAKVGLGTSYVTKEVKVATKLEESAVFARVKGGKYTGGIAKTFSKNDIEVGFILDGKSYTTSDFTLEEAYVDPINGDTKITIKYAEYTKEISAATAITGDVKANGTTGVKELINKVSTITPKTKSVINNNSISTVEAAIQIMETEKLDKYVNEAIDIGDANVAVKQDGTAAKLQAKVNTVDASVITNSLTPEEIIRVLAGEKVDLRLEVVVDETTDAKDTTGGQLIESNLNTNESAYYFTADLYKIFNDDEDNKSSITEFSDAISFTIDIPEEIRNEGRSFTLVASHELADGTFETFELVDIDDDDATFTASTTKLCTMALVYADEEVVEAPVIEAPIIEPEVVLNDGDVSPQTADLRNVLWTFIITVSAGAVLVVAFRKEFQ